MGASRARRVELVVLGGSTGGPEALAALLPGLPEDFPAPVVVVQHTSAGFTARLAARLDGRSAIRVVEACGGERLAPGLALLAPADHHVLVERDGHDLRLRTSREPPVHSVRPSLDLLLESAVRSGARCLAVVLSGMGLDGAAGCAAVRAAGGEVLVQDESTSVVWGMPGAVARRGLADAVLPLDRLAAEIVERVVRSRGRRPPHDAG